MYRLNRRSLAASATVVAVVLLGGCASESMTSLERQAAGSGRAGSIAALVRVADVARAEGDAATAAALYSRAHSLDGSDVEILVKLGGSLNDLGAADEAVQAFRKALKMEAANAEAMRGLGTAFLSANQPDLAIEQFEAALALEEDHRAYNGLGVALDRKGKHALAQAYYRVGLEIAPASVMLLNNLGLSLALSGDHADAIETLTRAASHPAATARQRQNLALAYGLAGNPEAAAKVAGMDLDAVAVEGNLARYSVLRAASVDAGNAAAAGPQANSPRSQAAPMDVSGAGVARSEPKPVAWITPGRASPAPGRDAVDEAPQVPLGLTRRARPGSGAAVPRRGEPGAEEAALGRTAVVPWVDPGGPRDAVVPWVDPGRTRDTVAAWVDPERRLEPAAAAAKGRAPEAKAPPSWGQDAAEPRPTLAHQIIRFWSGQLARGGDEIPL